MDDKSFPLIARIKDIVLSPDKSNTVLTRRRVVDLFDIQMKTTIIISSMFSSSAYIEPPSKSINCLKGLVITKESLNNDGQKFHKNQQNEQLHISSNRWPHNSHVIKLVLLFDARFKLFHIYLLSLVA